MLLKLLVAKPKIIETFWVLTLLRTKLEIAVRWPTP